VVTLIDHLLDAATLEVGRETLVREPVEVAAVVHDSLQIVGTHAREKGVGLRAAVPAGLTAWADRLKLEQVLVNLMANAVKFTPAGGEAVVSAEASGESTLLRVRDTGAGIRPEDLGRIFEPFFQGGEPQPPQPGERRARRTRGAGLGLAIVKRLVELHGGRVWAESEGPGRGSTFVVVLPRHQVDSAAA
jgi:signal transduction histidine kinase